MANEKNKRKKTYKYFAGFFIAIWCFTMLSSFIFHYTLPEVKVASPYTGPLEIKINTTGTVKAERVDYVYANGKGIVKEVAVQPGQMVKVGDPIATFDLEDLKVSHKKLTYDKALLEYDMSNAKENLSYFERASKDAAIDSEERKLATLKKEVELKQHLLEIGGASQKEVDEAVENLKQQMMILDTKLSESVTSANTFKKDMIGIEKRLFEMSLELASLEKLIANDGVLVSDYEGIVSSVHAQSGDEVTIKSKVAEIESQSDGYTATIRIEKNKSKHIVVGDGMTISSTKLGHDIKGVVQSVDFKVENGVKFANVTLNFETDKVQSGDEVDIRMTKRTKVYPTLVPKTALAQENGMTFLWVSKTLDKGFGVETTSKKVAVNVGEKDDKNAVILSGVSTEDVIITVVDNGKVLKDEGKIMIRKE